VAKVLRKLKDKTPKAKSQRHVDKPHGPLLTAPPDSPGPPDTAEGRSTLHVKDSDPFVDVNGQEGEGLSIEVEVAGDDVDEDPWESDQHPHSPLADDNT
jgi:hypothetical protein